MIRYQVMPPRVFINGVEITDPGPLYSGHDGGLNNSSKESVHDVGPIPRGRWRIVRWDAHHGEKGPNVAVLEPEAGTNVFGRSAFLIHGDNPQGNHSASHGCIIAGPAIRDRLHRSGESELEVV